MFDISRDEHIAFLTKLREDAIKDLSAQPDSQMHQEVFALIDRDLQNALRAQQQEREESDQKTGKPRKRAIP
jgi:hypothetical protein